MPSARSIIARVQIFAGRCALAGVACSVFSLAVAAQGGTVAVTGDGTSAAVSKKPDIGEAIPDDAPKGKNQKRKKGLGSDSAKSEAAGPDASGPVTSEQRSIAALVNDEPITGYEIDQRAMMLSGTNVQSQAKANFQAIIKNPKTSERLKQILQDTARTNQGKSRDEIIAIFERRKKEFGMSLQRQAFESARASTLPAMKKQALEELIDDRLKTQEAKRQTVTIEDAELDRVIKGIAERNKMTMDQFKQQIGGSLEPIKNRIRATLAWNEVVRKKFAPLINVTNRDVDKLVATSSISGEEDVELQLQRVRITMPAKIEEHGIAARIQDADKIRQKFTGCQSTSTAALGVAGARFEDLGKQRPSAIPEPTRTLVVNAANGEMLPPTVNDGAIELWVVCGREAIKASTDKRNQAEGELKQKEFELMAKRYLKDLREDAHIEYRINVGSK
ncbi:peptidylprolyl isomerase [Hyphomicrobium sp.]|jgi:peptidyl-prolyl cis-trans isomerase SurA|uniref:peptidylprolyl isomerase n=1 Tax=Hyphomicrobium sp. TaxID=82 RepID=UPI0035664FD8